MVLIVFLKDPLWGAWECFWGEKSTTSFCNLTSNKQDKVDDGFWRVNKIKLIWTKTERIPTSAFVFLVHSGLSGSVGGFLPVNPPAVFGGVWQNVKVGQEWSWRLSCQTIRFRENTKKKPRSAQRKKLEGSKLRPCSVGGIAANSTQSKWLLSLCCSWRNECCRSMTQSFTGLGFLRNFFN